jgi:hypothetical protein
MSRPDEHQIWLDERAATLRDRDHQREPRAAFRYFKPGRAPARTVRLSCPQCNGPVYAMSDSIGEAITCTHPDCHAELVTRAVKGAIGLVPVEGGAS